MEAMQTNWPGLAPPPINIILEDVTTPMVAVITLLESPTVTRIALSFTPQTQTKAISIAAVSASVYFALDTDPLPQQVPISGTVIPAAVFGPGVLCEQGQERTLALPPDSLPHFLHVSSRTDYASFIMHLFLESV
jgi:hypothetical protein